MTINLEGAKGLLAKLNELGVKAKEASEASVTVGYTQNYALYVHEIPAYHVVGEVEYLMKAVRATKKEVQANIIKAYQRGATLEQALLIGGLRFQREAMNRTPIDTGALRASAFTDLTKNVERVSLEAFIKSERIRITGQQHAIRVAAEKKLKRKEQKAAKAATNKVIKKYKK